MNSFVPISNFHSNVVSFQKPELAVILSLYGRMVAAGEWRDYGISSLKEVAIFSVFKRTAENPIYKIEKRPTTKISKDLYDLLCDEFQIDADKKIASKEVVEAKNKEKEKIREKQEREQENHLNKSESEIIKASSKVVQFKKLENNVNKRINNFSYKLKTQY